MKLKEIMTNQVLTVHPEERVALAAYRYAMPRGESAAW